MSASRTFITGLIIAALVGAAAWILLKPGDEAAQPGEPPANTQIDGRTNDSSRPAAASRSEQAVASQSQVAGVANSAAVPGSDLDMRTLASCHVALEAKKFAERQIRCDD